MKSKNFASICTGTSNASGRRAGKRSIDEPQGAVYAGPFALGVGVLAFFAERLFDQALSFMTGADDGLMVLDLNGNGSIDSGSELFGVDTVLSGTPGVNAVYARTGFEALDSLDANGDGVFNSADAAFTQVKLWQDLNQDGVSQSNELFTLANKGIASISLAASATSTNLGNGNVVSGTAVVTRVDGSSTAAAAVNVNGSTTAANLDLANNPFYREFTTPVALITLAQDMPQMQGIGCGICGYELAGRMNHHYRNSKILTVL